MASTISTPYGIDISNFQKLVVDHRLPEIMSFQPFQYIHPRSLIDTLEVIKEMVKSDHLTVFMDSLDLRLYSCSEEIQLSEREVIAIRGIFAHTTSCDECLHKKAALVQKLINHLSTPCEASFYDTSLTPPLLKIGRGLVDLTVEDRTVIMHFPTSSIQGRIFAWITLVSKMSGYHVFVIPNLIDEIRANVLKHFQVSKVSNYLVNYWIDPVVDIHGRKVRTQIDEIVSDIFGVLDLGPAGAIGLIGHLKEVFLDQWVSRQEDHASPPMLRELVVSRASIDLDFENKGAWSYTITNIVKKDCPNSGTIFLGGLPFRVEDLVQSITHLVFSVLNDPLRSLGNKSLKQFRVWNREDQKIADDIGVWLSNQATPIPYYFLDQEIKREHIKHLFAAAAIESLKSGANDKYIFGGVLKLLYRT